MRSSFVVNVRVEHTERKQHGTVQLNLQQQQLAPNNPHNPNYEIPRFEDHVVACEANPRPDLLPRSSSLYSNATLHRCYTHGSDKLLRSILKRKCNHLSSEQALE